jgi:hypothetical protein
MQAIRQRCTDIAIDTGRNAAREQRFAKPARCKYGSSGDT